LPRRVAPRNDREPNHARDETHEKGIRNTQRILLNADRTAKDIRKLMFVVAFGLVGYVANSAFRFSTFDFFLKHINVS
jgi:hypothetical protein